MDKADASSDKSLHRATETLTFQFIQTVKKHADVMRMMLMEKGLYPGQPSLLRALTERDGQSQKELAAVLRNKAATITVMLKRMEKAGLVLRRPDAHDQRITRVYLTEQGRKAFADVEQILLKMENVSLNNFTEEELRQFRHLISKLNRNLEHIETNAESDLPAKD